LSEIKGYEVFRVDSRRHHEHVFTSRGPAIETRADRLDSWKEIAAFLDRTVRTVQRWEQQEGLPVYRHLHARGQSVYAYKQEAAAWQLFRSTRKPPAASIPAASPDWLSQLCYLCLD